MTVDVSDHAVLRWMERVEKIDISAVRARISTIVGKAADIDLPYVTHDGFAIILEGGSVITILDRGQQPKRKRPTRINRRAAR